MPFTYEKFKNFPDRTTPIDADILNEICDYLVKLSSHTNVLVDVQEGGGAGSGVIYRVGFACQMNLTLTKVSLSNPLFVMPDGFKPSINFDTPLISTLTGEVVGVISYDRVADKLMFNSDSATLNSACKATVCYICDDII